MPALADQAEFLNSESSFYLVLHAHRQVQRHVESGRHRTQGPCRGAGLMGPISSGVGSSFCQRRRLVHEQARQRPSRRWSRSIRCWQQPAVIWINEPPDATIAKEELRLLKVG